MLQVLGCILVSAAWTDLGDDNERLSGYFNRPWEWAAIKGNAQFIHQFHSDDDHLIPITEARHIAQNLQVAEGRAEVVYEELQGHSHFFSPFQNLLQAINRHCEGFR